LVKIEQADEAVATLRESGWTVIELR